MPALPPNQLVLPETDQTIPFTWKGDSANGRQEPYAALLIPVTLPGYSKQLYMQFDLGSPYSMFYLNKVRAVVQVQDTSTRLTNFGFNVGSMPVLAKEMALKRFDTAGLDPRNPTEIIGTLGSDLIEGRVLTIDYPRRLMVLGMQWPENMNIPTADLIFARRSILLPATIRGKKTMLYFDTGSSAFELLTDKQTSLQMAAPGAVPASYPVRSWEKMLTANTLLTNDSIDIAQQKIPIRAVTYMEGVTEQQMNQMMKLGIGGMTGNKLFLHYVLVIDTRNKKFGLGKH